MSGAPCYAGAIIPHFIERILRDQKFRGYFIAKNFNRIVRWLQFSKIKSRAMTCPDVCQFVCHSKHLRGFPVRIIDEHKGGKIIRENKSPAFIHRNRAMCVILNHTINYCYYTNLFNAVV